MLCPMKGRKTKKGQKSKGKRERSREWGREEERSRGGKPKHGGELLSRGVAVL